MKIEKVDAQKMSEIIAASENVKVIGLRGTGYEGDVLDILVDGVLYFMHISEISLPDQNKIKHLLPIPLKLTTQTHRMLSRDWQPLIDAMAYLKHLPQCGDVAEQLEKMFVDARDGKYYLIEIAYENMDGKCFVVGQEFELQDKT